VEPLEEPKSQSTFDFDLSSSDDLIEDISLAISTGKVVVTERKKTGKEADGHYHVRMFHPGLTESSDRQYVPRDVAMVTVRIPALIERVRAHFANTETLHLYIYDSTGQTEEVAPLFMGGAILSPESDRPIIVEQEMDISNVTKLPSTFQIEGQSYEWGTRKLYFVITAPEKSFSSDMSFVIFGAVIMFLACIGLAMWIFTNAQRDVKLSQMKSAMMLENAKKMAQVERELNDFVAHEVRNPLSAAMSASEFVASALNEKDPLATRKGQESMREDISIVQSSLHFINDLLRTMLDINRASSKQIQLEIKKVDILNDVLEPVATMLYRRGLGYEVITECPRGLIVESDRIRLAQIVMNLARNSSKFVSKGFVRLRAAVVDGSVCLFVEDSGPGRSNRAESVMTSRGASCWINGSLHVDVIGSGEPY